MKVLDAEEIASDFMRTLRRVKELAVDKFNAKGSFLLSN